MILRRVFAVLVIGPLVACAGPPSPPPDTPQAPIAPPPTETATATFTPSPSPTPSSTPTPTPIVLSDDQLKSLALDIADLQPGYSGTADDTGIRSYDDLIAQDSADTASALRDRAHFPIYTVLYRRISGASTAIMFNLVIAFNEVEGARDYLAGYVSLFPKENLEPMSFDPLGEESSAFSGQVEGNEGFIQHRIAIRRRNIVVELRMVSAAGSGLEEFIQYAALLDERLADAIGEGP